jgi:hypothetical protein
MLPEVEIRPDPSWKDNPMYENPQDWRENDDERHDPRNDPPQANPPLGGPGMGGDDANNQNTHNGNIPVTVAVPNGHCLIGSIAAGIQILQGAPNAAAAITSAIAGLNAAGLNTNLPAGTLGIQTNAHSVVAALDAAGFNASTNSHVQALMNGGLGIAVLNNLGPYPGHAILLTGIVPGTGTDGVPLRFTYFESISGAGHGFGEISASELNDNGLYTVGFQMGGIN